MSKNQTTQEQKKPRTTLRDLTKVGEELSPEQLRTVAGGLRMISGPTCSSTCSCEYSDDGQGY